MRSGRWALLPQPICYGMTHKPAARSLGARWGAALRGQQQMLQTSRPSGVWACGIFQSYKYKRSVDVLPRHSSELLYGPRPPLALLFRSSFGGPERVVRPFLGLDLLHGNC